MTRSILAALTLISALLLAGMAQAQTQRTQLTDQAWVDLGAAPYTVRTLGSPAAIVIDTAPPSGLNVPFTVLGSEIQTGMPVTVAGTHAYARALNTSTAVATFPAAVASGGGTSPTTTTTGALQPPTAAPGKIAQTSVAVAAATSTQLVAANTARIAVELQCDGTAPVGVDRTGGTLTSATAAPLVLPATAYQLYIMPIATLTAITAYTATAQTCRVTEYLR